MDNKPDFSNFLAHFTKDGKPSTEDVYHDIQVMNAKGRLISILRSKKITATEMPWTHANAVCFTECPWSSLIAHTRQYSQYGIGFSKPTIFSKHGGPVYYMRPDHFKKQMSKNKFDKHVWPFITPFSPAYRPKHMKGQYFSTVDYSHEREWRVPHDFPFEYDDIEFVVLSNYKDMAEFPSDLKDVIGRDKFILMENYLHIEKLWPVHLL